MPQARTSPFREKRYFKEIGWILLIKLCLLVALRLLFFASPDVKPDGAAATSNHLLGTSAGAISVSASPSTSEKRSSHDQ